jgi:hypothetical protein
MDQKVLATLIDSKAYNKLTNGTLDVKTIKENEIPEIFSPRLIPKKKIRTEDSEIENGKISPLDTHIVGQSAVKAF